MDHARFILITTLAAALALGSCTASGDASTPPVAGSRTAADAHVVHLDGPRELITRDGAYRVTWMPIDGAIPINDHFEVDVTVTRNDEARTPVTGADVSMTCFMPDHGHGMLREPRTEELTGGHYRIRGFLLHMDGYWTVSITVVVDRIAATADDELNL